MRSSALLFATSLCAIALWVTPAAARELVGTEGRTVTRKRETRGRSGSTDLRHHEQIRTPNQQHRTRERGFHPTHTLQHRGGRGLLGALTSHLKMAAHKLGFTGSKGRSTGRETHIEQRTRARAETGRVERFANMVRTQAGRLMSTVSSAKTRLLAHVRQLAPQLIPRPTTSGGGIKLAAKGKTLAQFVREAKSQLRLPGDMGQVGSRRIRTAELRQAFEALRRQFFALNAAGITHGNITAENVVITEGSGRPQLMVVGGWNDSRQGGGDVAKDLQAINALSAAAF